MTGRYQGTVVIKKCIENPEHIVVRVSALESMHSFPYKQDNPFRARTTTWEGHCFEEVVMASLMSEDAGKMLCASMLDRMNEMTWLTESKSGKDVEFLRYKLENFYPVKIAIENYGNEIISCQTDMSKFFECGKYLIEITGTSDMLTLQKIIDLKYYSQKFGEKHDNEYEEYTLDNFEDSVLKHKKQWYLYSYMLDMERFEYHLYTKGKNAPSKNNPEKYLEYKKYKCFIDKDKAEAQIKKDIIRYVQLCQENNVPIGTYLETE